MKLRFRHFEDLGFTAIARSSPPARSRARGRSNRTMLFRSRQPTTLINCGLAQVGGSTTPDLDRRSKVVTVVDNKRLGNPIVQP